jgi:hypothetical protein
MKAMITAVLCLGLIVGPVIAQDELKPSEPNPALVTTQEDAEVVLEQDFSDKHPKLYAAGWTLVISVIGYALLAAIDKAGGDTVYNVGGDLNNANGNGGNGSSDSSDTNQSTGMGNNER